MHTSSSQRTLIVDVDGTLCPVDTLRILRWRWILRHPTKIHYLRKWRHQSKQLEKIKLWDLVGFRGRPQRNEAVVQLMNQWKAGGGRVAVVTGSAHGLAEWICTGLGIPTLEIFGSNETINLTKEAKAKFILETVQFKNVTYVGDSPDDVFVWRSIHSAIAIDNGATRAIDFALMGTEVSFIPQLNRIRRAWTSLVLLFQP